MVALSPMLFQPSVNGETVAFVHKGDVFVATAKSGWEAVQLTKTAGSESFPKVSPDGRQVAYLDPAGAVRVIQVAMTESKRLTFGPRARAVLGWKDAETIGYASEEASPLPESYGLSFVNAKGGQPTHTGIQEIGNASFSKDGSKMIFSRSLPSTGSQSLFHGGEANQIIRMDLVSGKVTMPFPSRYSRMFSHQVRGDIYFVGTEGQKCLNLWRIRHNKFDRLTDFKLDGVRYLSGDDDTLVFEQGGSLYRFDPITEKIKQIPIRLTPEQPPLRTTREISKWISEVTVAPNGGAVGFVSRGKAYAMTTQGLHRLTTLEESDESHLTFSKDGSHIAFSVESPSDRGLFQWNAATGQALRIASLPRDPSWIGWSADGSTIFYALDRQAIFSVDSIGIVSEVGKLPRWTTSYSVSHDGRYVAVTNAVKTKRTSLAVFDRKNKSTLFPSDGRYEDIACAFDQRRPVLYLLSRRQGRPNLGGLLPDLNLSGGMVLIEIPTEDGSIGRSKSGKWIDLGDLAPTSISATSGGVWLHDESGDFRWNPDTKTIKKSVIPGVLEPWGMAAINQVAKKLTTHSFKEDEWRRAKELTVDGDVTFDPRSEWRTIFWAAHRFHSDQFYDPLFGGVDWKTVGMHYEKYLPQVTSRGELQSVLSRMTGELIGGHNGISSSSEEIAALPQSKAPHSGMVVSWDGIGNRVLYVFRGRDDLPLFGSVSNPVEGKIKVGDYIVAVNGIQLTRNRGFDEVTENIGRTDLKLDIAHHANGPTQAVVVTLPGRYLRYSDFLIRSEETVDRLSGGQIAYVHIFDTASQGGGSFADGFFGQTQKLGFILDARWNRGGFSNPGFINALLEPSLFREAKRYGDSTLDRPKIEGPIALLINREAVSGGDLLAHAFQSRKIGPIIGTTTSGRTIGNQWYRQLADGTTVRTSEANLLDVRTGRSSGENFGVRPDEEIEIAPRLTFSMIDDQLETAVKRIIRNLNR